MMTKHREALLNDLLRALVGACGYDEVQRALAELGDGTVAPRKSSSVGSKPRKKKPTASELVERAEAPESHKMGLSEIALQFDRKNFLPSVADAREFLVLLGRRP